MIDCVD